MSRQGSRLQAATAWQGHRARQQGLSLIELMITMVLGLIIIAAVFNMYAGSSRSARYSEGLQSMQENGRYGVSVLQRGLRLAGFSPDESVEAFDISASGVSTISIRSQQQYDCNGLETTATDGLAVNVYRLDEASGELTCQGNQGGAPMAVVEGVDRFRLLYGVDADGDAETEEPQSYVPHDATLDSADVVAVRFALLVNSGKPIRTRNVSRTYVLLDEEFTYDDRVAREVFSSTVKVRNRQ
ncbi:PilW family protein [Granulosicoccus sp. 3-233]|uniref:PilW family protein n=1 Tax=Granulosicoccus sp. 3-233 TaxID=3417969 RepID=UPI003D32F8D7